jgi:hypothetical protein
VHLAGLLIALFVGSACYADEDTFATRQSKLYCKRMRECHPSTYEEIYDSELSECVDDQKSIWAFVFEECEYDPAEGKKCLREIYERRDECGEHLDEEISMACAFDYCN